MDDKVIVFIWMPTLPGIQPYTIGACYSFLFNTNPSVRKSLEEQYIIPLCLATINSYFNLKVDEENAIDAIEVVLKLLREMQN